MLEPLSPEGRTPGGSGGGANASLSEVVVTPELSSRATRVADYRAENEALVALSRAMTESPDSLFQVLIETAMRLTGAQSAGISLLVQQDDQPIFQWTATAGRFTGLLGQVLPRDFSPCGLVVDRDALQVLREPERYYSYLAGLQDPIFEGLLIPFHWKGKPIGTVWVVRHERGEGFDAEHARIMTSLSGFAAAAWQTQQMQNDLRESQAGLQRRRAEEARSRSELVVAREQARQSEARFRAFFDQSPYYAGLLTTDGILIEISHKALATCGYRREEMVGRPFWQTGWWHGSTQVQRTVELAFAQTLEGRPFKAELPYFFADGSERITEFGLSPVFDDQGVISFVIATGADITDRVLAQRQLAAAQRRLDSALIAGEMGVFEWDVLQNRIYGDANFLRLFDRPISDLAGVSLDVIANAIHPEDREEVAVALDDTLRTGANIEADYRVRCGDAERWINARGRTTRNAAGEVVSLFGVVVDISDRKLAEQARVALAEELERVSSIYEIVLSATDDFAYIFDREGRFLYANRQLLKVWSKSLHQIIGKTCHELGYPKWHADLHMREIAQVIETGQALRGEVPFTGASGISGIYDYIFTPVLGEEGEVELVAGTSRDVTERRRNEDRDRFLVALDDATRPLQDPDEITQTYARLLAEHLNVNRCAYADVEADENTFNLTGDHNRGVPSIVGRYRFDQFGEECLRLMRANEIFVVEDSRTDPRTAAVRASYEATRIRAVICVPLHKSGTFVAAMAVHHTEARAWAPAQVELVQLVANRCWESIERSRVLRALAQSEQHLRLAVETARLGIWEVDVRKQELRCSAQCKANFGRPAEAPFSSEEFWAAMHPDDRPRVQAAIERAITDHVDYEQEYRSRWPDGSEHWIFVRGQAHYTSEGVPLRLVGVSLDITGRKQAEQELARLHEEAVRASRAKDDFLAALSHELRTPLNPVLLLASEGAVDPDLPPQARDAFGIIRKNVELEARLIDDLLDLTSIARGKLQVRKQSVHVHDVVQEAVAAMQTELTAKEIDFRLQLTAAPDRVHADADRLVQVVLNLLRNAVKFTPAKGRITLTTEVKGAILHIEVADTGIGMTEPELARAFGAFEQGEHAAKPGAHRFGGLGLGLAIARQLVELHGGTIAAASPGRGCGCVCTVTLPLLPELVGTEREWPAPAAPAAAPPAATRSEKGEVARVLLVEDHDSTRKTLARLLERRGYAVTSAATCEEAKRHAQRDEFDFVVSDIGLPDGDGAELMRELRQEYGLRGLALTGYGMKNDIDRCYAAGFVSHLTKPVRVEALEAALVEVTRSRQPPKA
jgi:PAS domain S-box-containing protein